MHETEFHAPVYPRTLRSNELRTGLAPIFFTLVYFLLEKVLLRHLGGNNQHVLQHHRPPSLIQQHKPPESPHQKSTNIPAGAYSAPTGLNGVPLPHHPSYHGTTQDQGYYASHSNPYPATTTPTQYPSSGPPDLMAAAAHMQRPYPPIYHTPQSNSPASVPSPQTHDQHGRSLYAQSPQMAPQMYGYQPYSPMNSVHPAYAQHHPPPQQPLTTQPLMMPPQSAPIPHSTAQPHQSPMNSAAISNSPRTNVETIPQRTPIQTQRPQMPNPSLTSPNTPVPPLSASSAQANQTPNPNSTNAAPGPIPATTPLVVRQDSNGVQWIAFEYSRDRVKMEYTIRCDVESVNVESLSQEFKTENCVYPRACCSKDQYRGNRLVYETECNAVGWALAELNPPLRGKRGLIQRAVDSWRNSNQDPRLRSRRVRRMAKINRRQGAQPNPIPSPSTPLPHLLSGNSTTLAPSARPSGPMPLASPLHHAHTDNPAGNDQVSGGTDFTNGVHRPSIALPSATPSTRNIHETPDLRSGHVFHGLPTYPAAAHSAGAPSAPAMAPPLQAGGGFDTLGRPSVATASRRGDTTEHEDDEMHDPDNEDVFGSLPEGKRRKFILVDDPQRNCRVRVKVMLDQVDVNEIPDSYRLSSAVYPRAYFPVQMKSPPGRVVPGKRYADDESDEDTAGSVTMGRTLVPTPTIDGESDDAVPRLTRTRHHKDKVLNDLGYRMSWSQSRVFAGRQRFLQRSLDAYRNKMRTTMLSAGQESESIASHFETRPGKRKWRGRSRKNDTSSRSADVIPSTSRHEADEVEG
ncbi:hypothetical protein BGW36DRAFT_104164 [Talaromyces proteolyticus]|uniref:DUF8032 domain-containing protein n=1 Tax=Talaromyces proteolyticus TaxID=1131652 RepID=A0AAD4KWQ5_9EURO|nr:uncharacterized protein BGW36DRAFT_104164 [Talaromyces proteolyticus]KAH8701731.1 hypothetical protein BGW36DRAFT_104164 [Talaromyces proteolyticus]